MQLIPLGDLINVQPSTTFDDLFRLRGKSTFLSLVHLRQYNTEDRKFLVDSIKGWNNELGNISTRQLPEKIKPLLEYNKGIDKICRIIEEKKPEWEGLQQEVATLHKHLDSMRLQLQIQNAVLLSQKVDILRSLKTDNIAHLRAFAKQLSFAQVKQIVEDHCHEEDLKLKIAPLLLCLEISVLYAVMMDDALLVKVTPHFKDNNEDLFIQILKGTANSFRNRLRDFANEQMNIFNNILSKMWDTKLSDSDFDTIRELDKKAERYSDAHNHLYDLCLLAVPKSRAPSTYQLFSEIILHYVVLKCKVSKEPEHWFRFTGCIYKFIFSHSYRCVLVDESDLNESAEAILKYWEINPNSVNLKTLRDLWDNNIWTREEMELYIGQKNNSLQN